MPILKRHRLIGAAVGALGATALAATLSFGSVSAQTSPQATPTRPAQAPEAQTARSERHGLLAQYLDRLAQKLGVSRERLENALKELRQEIQQERRDLRQQFRVRAGTNVLDIVARVTGQTRDDVMRQLREGKSLVEIAAAKGKSEADLKTAILADAKTKLVAQVSAGRLTRERADRAYQQIESGLSKLLNAKMTPRGRAASTDTI